MSCIVEMRCRPNKGRTISNERVRKHFLAIRCLLVSFLLVGFLLVMSATTATAATSAKSLPKFSEVQQTVLKYFQTVSHYKPGDLISRGQVRPVFEKLESKGWRVADQGKILKQVLSDQDFLVRQLHSTAGRKYMRKVAQHSKAYEQLDKLARIPFGERTIRDLIRGRTSSKLRMFIKSDTKRNPVGDYLSKSLHAPHLQNPSKRIYTVNMLLARLKTSYQAMHKSPGKVISSGKRSSK